MKSIRIIEPVSEDEFKAYYQVRYDALRKPWNKPPGSEKDETENESLHFSAVENGVVIGVCRLQYNADGTAQVRYMAVDEKYRGKNIGSLLLCHVEKRAIADGKTKMILQARDYAVPFYEVNGYVKVEKSFLLWGEIQHYLMEKEMGNEK